MKNVLFLTVTTLILLVFTGCRGSLDSFAVHLPSKKDTITNERCKQIPKLNKAHCEDNKYELIRVRASSNLSTYGMKYLNFNNSNSAIMQAMAKSTLYQKKKYFAIVEPEIISSFSGAIMNTPDEFFKKCDINMASFFVNRSPCNLHSNGYGHVGVTTIALYDERPSDLLVYDAQKALEYLKTNNRFDAEATNWNYKISTLTEKQFATLADRFNH